MGNQKEKRTFAERLYKINKLSGANNARVDLYDVVFKKIEDPPFEDEENNNEKGSL